MSSVLPRSVPVRLTTAALALSVLLLPAFARAAHVVDSLADAPDLTPGDGSCDAGGFCTLRAALEEANANPGVDIIQFAPSIHGMTIAPSAPYVTLTSPDGDSTILDGVGASMTIDGGGVVPSMMTIAASSCEVHGLTITGFGIGLQILNGISNTVGGPLGLGNTITLNGIGLRIYGAAAELNLVLENLITDNTSHGVVLTTGASRNTLQHNVCVSNGGHGFLLDGNLLTGVTPGPVEQNALLDNFVGMLEAAPSAAPNTLDGIHMTTTNPPTGDVRYNRVENSVVSANGANGITMTGSQTFGNTTQGNRVGLDVGGATDFGNGANGVAILQGAHGNLIGPPVAGNLDVISGNGQDGVWIDGVGTGANEVRLSHVGMDISGQIGRGNDGNGVHLSGGTQDNFIQRCVISDNGDNGVLMEDGGTDANRVADSHIGTDVDGLDPFGNGLSDPDEGGVLIDNGPSGNWVGPGNLVSDHQDSMQFGVCLRTDNTQMNYVHDNVIGLDITQAAEMPNFYGVFVDGASQNEIGPGNVISGNDSHGVLIEGNINDVFQNVIGLDWAEAVVWPNLDGIYLNGQFNEIGRGASATDGNVICANDEWGILANTDDVIPLVGNEAHGNWIGVTSTGAAQGNGLGGVWMRCGVELDVLGTAYANEIAYNGPGSATWGQGVLVGETACGAAPDALGNEIVSNSIHSNQALGIDLEGPGNHAISAPTIQSGTVSTTTATVQTNLAVTSHVQLFHDDAEEGRVLVADNPSVSGSVAFSFAAVPLGSFLTATNTADVTSLGVLETSEFSTAVEVLAGTDVRAEPRLPTEMRLVGGSPNPFRSTMTITFELPRISRTSIRVYDVTGRRVRTVQTATFPPGRHHVVWDGKDEAGSAVAAGTYFVRLETADGTCMRRASVLR